MSAPELSRIVKVRPLPADPISIVANADELSALATRFGLPSIEQISAEIDVEESGKAIKATGTLSAKITQTCAVSGDDFPTDIEEAIALRFVEQGSVPANLSEDGEIEIELDAADCDEIEYEGDAIDLGEALAQTLGLAIDPYAEGPNADAVRKESGIVAEGEQDGPLAAALAALKKD